MHGGEDMAVEAHIHQFEDKIIKVRLYDWKVIRGKWNNIMSGYDHIKVKDCKCGTQVAYGVKERVKV